MSDFVILSNTHPIIDDFVNELEKVYKVRNRY
jgi:hypothetical protein